MSFHYEKDVLYCERLRVKDIQDRVPDSPFYLYSRAQLAGNYRAYTSALGDLPAIVSYALKANSNLTLLTHLRRLGAGATLVSGNELRLALAAGFEADRALFNGNGKTVPELQLAARHGVMFNIDSEFDLMHIEQAARDAARPARVLIRINPDLDPEVHPYVATGIRDSKFGIHSRGLSKMIDRVRAASRLELVGVHCHLGSTIQSVEPFREAAALMVQALAQVRCAGFEARYVNIGGGLGIDYKREEALPETADLIDAVRPLLGEDVTLVIEPGRSIVGSAGVLVGRVIGVKEGENKRFIVTDASMSELIRPSLYGAYHHIGFVEPAGGRADTFDVVGPVCESADFLGKDRKLATPREGAGVVVFDTGAYGYAMSSNYNARTKPGEYLVDGDELTCIRRAERFEDHMRLFDVDGSETEG